MEKSPCPGRHLAALAWALAVLFGAVLFGGVAAADSGGEPGDDELQAAQIAAGKAEGNSANSADSAGAKSGSKQQPYSELLDEAETVEGLIRLHRKDAKLYGEIAGGDLNKDLIVIISIARGIGRRPLAGGMTWGFGDD